MSKPPSTRVMEIFSEAATSEAPRRDAYLDLACGGDTELRAEVESLLATQPKVERFLDAPTVDGDDLLDCGGGVVGRYTILERLGEGGFGVVYAARQDRPMRRDVALKIVKLGMDTRQIIRRFDSERQALALMDHPGIARIYDAGATPDGRPYFAMELVRGSPLTDYCDDKRLTIDLRLELFMAVCQAVQHAHQKGIIHRDLKPSNILVVEVDGSPVPKVIDFGIAKAIAASPGEQTACTEQRQFVGTPQYMSPEQAGAGDGDVDTRSDIYSLGVLLYELLTGATPFDPEALKRTSYDQVHRIVREEEPVKPSVRLATSPATLPAVAERRGVDGARLRRTVSGELDWIVARALEKDRQQRYPSAGALWDDVRRYLAHEPLSAGPPDAMYRVRKFARKHRKPLLAAGAVALALVLGLAGTTFGLVRARRDGARAEAALIQAEQVSRFLSEMLRSANPDRARGKDVLVRDVLDNTSRSIDRGALKDQPLVEAGIRGTLGASYESLGLYAESEAQFRQSLEIRRRVLGDDHRETARTAAALAWALHNRADIDAAEPMARRAVEVSERLFGRDHPELIEPLIKLGLILRYKGDKPGAEAILRRAVELARRGPADATLSAQAATNLAVLLMDRGDDAAAEPLLRESLALDREAQGENFRNVPRNLSNLAVILDRRGDYPAAEAHWLEALGRQRELLPASHPDTAWTLRLLGLFKKDRGDFAAGEKYTRDALEMERKVFGPNHPVVAMLLDDLAAVLRAAGRAGDAADARRQALDVRLAHHRAALADKPAEASRQGAVAQLHLRRGQFAEGLAGLEEAARLAPGDPQWLLQGACARLYLGDGAGYRAARDEIVRRCADADPKTAAWAARAAALAPLAPADVPPVARLAARAPADAPGPNRAYYALCRGVAEWRAGDAAGAVNRLRAALDSNPVVTTRVAAGCYLSLALRARGDAAGAAVALDGALAAAKQLPTVADGDIGIDPEEWMVCQIALREAQAAAGAIP